MSAMETQLEAWQRANAALFALKPEPTLKPQQTLLEAAEGFLGTLMECGGWQRGRVYTAIGKGGRLRLDFDPMKLELLCHAVKREKEKK